MKVEKKRNISLDFFHEGPLIVYSQYNHIAVQPMKAGNLSKRTLWFLAVGTIIASATFNPAQGQVHTLADGNSTALINVGGQDGMFNWTVDGVDQLGQQWFWYRIGDNPEASIDKIGPAAVVQNGNLLTTTYTSPQSFSLRVDYLLTGGLPGSGSASIVESVSVQNLSAAPLAFHFFQYSDFDLAGTKDGDYVALGVNGFGQFNEAIQTKGNILLSEIIEETAVVPAASHGEAAFYNTTLMKLNNGVADTLSDVAGPLGPGNVTWAFQWDQTIPVEGSFNLSKTKLLQVPEPFALAFVSLGLALCFLRRRRD